MFGDGRVKVYGSWGRYFDWVKYELSRGTFGGDIWRVYYRSLDTAERVHLLANANVTNLPGTQHLEQQPRVRSATAAFRLSTWWPRTSSR